MTRNLTIIPGRVYGDKDGVSYFDTDAYPVQYANSVLSVTGYSLVWPDFQKGNAYNWQQWDSGNANNDPRESAISLITIPNQEWGPASSNPTSGCQLDDVVLGTVPAGSDHILVRVKANRTVAPSQINGNTIPQEQQPNQWTIAYGGTLLFEQLYPIVRMIYVYLADTDNGDGTRNVLLRRLMSVVKNRQSFYRSGNDYNRTGWNYGGTYGSYYGVPVSQRDTRGPSTDLSGVGSRFKRTGSNPAATNDNTNYSSTYTVDFEIIPGRSNITPVSGSGSVGAQFAFFDEQSSQNSSTTHSRTMAFGDAAASRKLILSVAAFTSAGRDISSVSIGGVTASQVAYRRDTDYVAGIYIADVPSGTSGTVSVTFSGSLNSFSSSAFVLYAGYDMNSSTPDGTISTATDNTDFNLTTVAGGFAVAVSTNQSNYANLEYYDTPRDRFFINPIGNQALFPIRPEGVGPWYNRGHQLTTGATLTLRQKFLGAASGNPPLDPGQLAFVAASFH